MLNELFLGCTCLLTATAFTFSGCGETNKDRRQISQRTKDLAAVVKADAKSVEAQAAMKELIDILNSNWTFARCQACYAFKSLGPLSAPALQDLIDSANSGDEFVEDAAIGALRAMGPGASSAVDVFIAKIEFALSHRTYSTFSTLDAARALGDIGKPGLKAIPVLERASQHNDKFLAKEARKSLEKLRTQGKLATQAEEQKVKLDE